MKVLQSYTLDLDLVQKLKRENNASALINKLLSEHYKDDDLNNLSLEELKKRREILLIKIEANKKIEALKQNGS